MWNPFLSCTGSMHLLSCSTIACMFSKQFQQHSCLAVILFPNQAVSFCYQHRENLSGISTGRSHRDLSIDKEKIKLSENWSKLPEHIQSKHETVATLFGVGEVPLYLARQNFAFLIKHFQK